MQRRCSEAGMMVKYYLGGRLGHGMWSSVGWIFGTVETQVISKTNRRTDGQTENGYDHDYARPTGRNSYEYADLCPKFDRCVLLQTRMLPSFTLNDIDH